MLILLMLLSNPASAYESGNAPFCKMDNYGNLQCFYYTMTACQDSLSISSEGSTCVRNSKK